MARAVSLNVAHRSYFMLIMSSLIVVAWLVLWGGDYASYGRYLHIGHFGGLDPDGSICRLFPAGFVGGVLVPGILYVGGWTLMTIAMMLPTTLPLLEIFRRLTVRRTDHARLMTLLIVGYLGVWALFGVVALVGDWGLQTLLAHNAWLRSNAWVLGGGVLILAGAFQFSQLKYRCLDKCRSPLSFVMEHWRGKRERTHSLLLGVRHGAFCVGCCWALMLLMFAVGTGSVGWMLALAGIMAVEKNFPWGRELAFPLGAALLGCGSFIILSNLSLP
ncbi:MAG: DUF2182 domain-containing protein [Acidiferrobacterales bacterium]